MRASVANTDLVCERYAAFNREGVDAFGELLAPEVRWQERARTVALTTATRDDVLERMRAIPGWSRVTMEPLDADEVGNRVIVTVREVPRGDWREERTRVHVWTIEDGRAVRLEVHKGRGEAMWSVVGYLGLLERIHEHLRPRTYVEIGVKRGDSVARTQPGTKVVGIDPAPRLFDPAIAEIVDLQPTTSDDYFANNDLSATLGGLPVDVAFIDGEHLFEFALRDFMNLESYCSENSVIFAHDCYPLSRETSTRDWQTDAWNGDVWKIIPCLREMRPDLNVSVVDVRPTGLAVFTGLDPSSTVIQDRYDEIMDRYMPLDYGVLEGSMEEQLARVDNDWELIKALLPAPFSTRR